MTALATGPVALATSNLESALALEAPDLVTAFREHLPRALDVVARRVAGALHREGLAEAVDLSDGYAFLPGADVLCRVTRHGFNRIEVTDELAIDPVRLLERVVGPGDRVSAAGLELADATANLALAYARRSGIEAEVAGQAIAHGAPDTLALAEGLDADRQCVFFERLATDGHNLHPCGRTRLGWSAADLLAYDLEAASLPVGFVAVRRDIHIGDDVGPQLLPDTGVDPRQYAVTPVHPWQLALVRDRYADLVAAGALVPLEATVPAVPTAALRTLLLPDGRYVKVSLDIQVTSTRRTISVASTRNGPVLSRLLARLLPDDVLLMAETAGAAMVASGRRERDCSAIVRCGLSGQLAPDELAVPGSALCARSPVTGLRIVAELVQRFARTRASHEPATAALSFVAEYARVLLPPVLTLATCHGIGLEAHLQNCVLTFTGGVPQRLALRDFAGLRLFPPRLRGPLRLWPGSVVITSDVNVMRAKVAYTALQAHLGEIVVQLRDSHGLDERAAWAAVRGVVDEVYDGLCADRRIGARARRDHTFLTAPTLPHKALLSMRLRPEDGDAYVAVDNPLRWAR
jgi:siderophore synthetase component